MIEVKDVEVSFKDFKAIAGINVKFGEEKFTAIIGPNGAGKTTLINLISGYLRPSKGDIYLDGENITHLPAYKRVKRGIVRTFQIPSLFPYHTVVDHIIITLQSLIKERDAILRLTDLRERAEEVLKDYGLLNVKDKKASELPLGYKKKLELAMALCLNPRYLLIDEPFGGLSREEIDEQMEFIKKIVREKEYLRVIFVEHKLHTVMTLAERVIVMNRGKIIADGKPEEIRLNRVVQETYLGE